MKRNPKILRCRLVRFVDGRSEEITYIGPFEGWTRDWHMKFRTAAPNPRGGLAA